MTEKVQTATIGFDGSSDNGGKPLTAYGAFTPKPSMVYIYIQEKCLKNLGYDVMNIV